MCGTIALGLAGGLIASKLLFRFRHLRHDGPSGPHRRWGRRRFHAGADAPPPPVVVDAPRRLDARLAPLELSQRQAEETREAFADVSQALGPRWSTWIGLDEALAAVGAEPFDRARAVAALGPLDGETARRALDALEHVHNILTPEQRDQLLG